MTGLHIYDPGLAGHHHDQLVGHHHNQVQGLAEEAGRRGLACTCYAHAGFAAPSRFPVQPVFTAYTYHQFSRDPLCGDWETLAAHSEKLFADLNRLPPPPPGTVALFPSVNHYQLAGIARWADKIKPIPVVCLIGYRSGLTLVPEGIKLTGQEARIWRFAFNKIDSLNPRNLVVAASGDDIEDFRYLSHGRVVRHPVQFSASGLDLRRRETPNETPTILYAGDARPDKGFTLLPDILRQVLARHPTARAVVQINGFIDQLGLAPAAAALKEMARTTPRLTLIQGFLAHERYFSAVSDADIVLLPYDNEVYRALPSGQATEAMALGKPLVGPDGTCIGRQMRQYGHGGRTFARHTATDIAEAVLSLLDGLDTAYAEARRASGLWTAENGTDKLLDFILQAVTPEPAPGA